MIHHNIMHIRRYTSTLLIFVLAVQCTQLNTLEEQDLRDIIRHVVLHQAADFSPEARAFLCQHHSRDYCILNGEVEHDSQREALENLYASMRGANWRDSSCYVEGSKLKNYLLFYCVDWMSEVSICFWYGVTCETTPQGGAIVTELHVLLYK